MRSYICYFTVDLFFFPIVLRTVNVYVHLNRSVIISSGQIRTSISLANDSLSVTSANNLVAYRPEFIDSHGSDLGALFLNIEGIFPCTKSASYLPTCGILTREEDGFFQGRPFIQAADSGNHFRVFNSTAPIKTYGLAIQGCPEINSSCLPSEAAIAIFCLLPRQQCG